MGSRFADFLRRFTVPRGKASAREKSGRAVEYKGYTIRPEPRREGSQWLTAGVITKQFADEVKEQHFIRADKHGGKEAAEDFSITKAKQIIDEQGDKLFRDGPA